MSALEIISIVIDIVTTGIGCFSSIILTTLAVIGLTTWKKQLKGKTEYETARNLLRSVYKLRQSIQRYRNPFVLASENAEALKQAGLEDIKLNDPDYHAKSQWAIYKLRWKPVYDALVDLEIAEFDAETIWDKEITNLVSQLKQHVNRMFSVTEFYLRDLQRNDRTPPDLKFKEEIDDVLMGVKDHFDHMKESSFSRKIEDSVINIEGYLRSKMKL